MAQTLWRFLGRNIWVIVGLLLLLWVIRDVDWLESWQTLGRLTLWQIALLILLNIGVLLPLYGRWWVLLIGMGWPIPFWSIARYTLAGFAVSYLTPGPQFGGEPIQILALNRKHGVPLATGTASVAVEKMIGLVTDIGFLLIGLLIIVQTDLLDRQRSGLTLLIGIGIALQFAGLIVWWRRGRMPLSGFVDRIVPAAWGFGRRITTALGSTEAEIVTLCADHPRSLLLSALFSMLSWLIFAAEFLLTAYFIGIPLTPFLALLLLTAFRLAFLLPIPGGFGTVEAGQLWVLSGLGVQNAASLAISFSLLIHLRDLIIVAMGIWLLRSSDIEIKV